MEIEIRTGRDEDYDTFLDVIATATSHQLPEGFAEQIRPLVDMSRTLCACEGAQIVGTAEALRLTLTIPGGEVGAAGITTVGVLPTHRRRGILTQLMRRQLDDVREWGEPLAVLWSSEGGIYHRFGYGLATRNARLDAARDRFAFRWPAEPAGRVRLVSRDEALETLPAVYDRVRAVTPGFLDRSRDWWERATLAQGLWNKGAVRDLHAVFELDERPEAYALYSVEGGSDRGVSGRKLSVKEEISATPLATREIWRYLFGVDLIDSVRVPRVAPDHPLFLMAAEPARLGFSMGDGLFVRVVDVHAALSARSYAGDGALVIELADHFCSWNEQVWRIAAEGGRGEVEQHAGPADLRLGVADLGSAYLGGFSFAELWRAGRVDELTAGAVARADALFRTDRAPWCPAVF
jgi:predicted acetyltransferase